MRIGLIDVDGHNFPSLPLMKLSAYHKGRGDLVEWYMPFGERYDRVYMSKVFSFTAPYDDVVNADEVIRGGTGYAIELAGGREHYHKERDVELPYEVEHAMPDYALYPSDVIWGAAFGFLSRGCPRGCHFCHVAPKEGRQAHKVADLGEFWDGQRKIVLLDANLLACPDWAQLVDQLARTGAEVDITQGLDARLLDESKAQALAALNMPQVHFARDRYADKDAILPRLELWQKYSKASKHYSVVYTLVNFDTTFEEDLARIYELRALGYWAYVMVYDKEHAAPQYRRLQRWCNNRYIFGACKDFNDYKG